MDVPRAATSGAAPLFCFKVLQPDPTSRAQAAPRLFNATQEAWVMLETVVEPVFFRFRSINTPAGLPCRVMTISCVSASRR
jgi:hypothetical protein